MKHSAPFGPLMKRVELHCLFKIKVLSRRDEIVDAYYAVMDNQSPIDDNNDEDDDSDSEYCPGDESDYGSGKDNDELRKGIDANELAHLQSDNSLSPESLRQLYVQRQAYPERLKVRKMIMAIFNTCVSYPPSNTSDYFLSFRFLFAALALSLILFLMTVALFRYKYGYCSIYKAQ
ncbi:hypothetical protein RMATCC62417_09886 [Rhizopus microsporus]|nr:hypothetical protein RMATCC62417_09886 [Rhizopus microsporus]